MNLSLIPIRALGADALAHLHATSFAAPWGVEEFERLLALPHVFGAAASAPAPIGFVLAWAPGEDAEILTLAVAPEARRRGVARALVAEALNAAAAAGASAMLLDVHAGNEAARALYAQAGFRPSGRRAGYYSGDPAGAGDALLLRRDLR